MFSRNAFSECLGLLSQFPVLGIVGSRQSGKTTLAKALTKSVAGESLYLDLENPRDLAKLEEAEFFLSRQQDKLVILDEIQHRPELFNLIRSLVDEHRVPGRFLILGSASPDLLRDSADSLAGRVAYLELPPLAWDEIKAQISMEQHWLRGGYPDALMPDQPKKAQRWLKNYLQTYVQRDLGLLGLNTTPTESARLFSLLSHLHGELLNYSAMGRSLGLGAATAKRYLHFLSSSYLIRELPPYFTNTRKRLVRSPKLYIRDSGLLHYLHRIESIDDLLGRPLAGHSWEGYVIEEIIKKGQEQFDFFFYRTQRGAECDLVICENLKPLVALEIKLTNAPRTSRGFYESIKDLKTPHNFILTPQSDRFPVSEDAEAISFSAFMEFLGGL
jgi:predicted AAA+ superfamily ATPase